MQSLWSHGLLTLLALVAAIQAVRSRSLLRSALWLAGVSASLAVLFYLLGAQQVAVIELSVGAGLVTVLFIFAISIAGDQTLEHRSPWMHLVGCGLSLLCAVLLAKLILPVGPQEVPASDQQLTFLFWNARGLDVLVQVVLIFSGVMGTLGLLAEAKAPLDQPMLKEVAALRENDLREMELQSLRTEQSTTEVGVGSD